MKYWLLTSEYPPFFGGGISTYCHFTAEMLAENGHEVTVFINDNSVERHEISQSQNIRLIRFNPDRSMSSSLGHVTNISYEFSQIVKLFIENEGQPDVIESQEYLGIAYYLLQFKLLKYEWCREVFIVITMHSPSFLYMEYNQVSQFRYPNYWICEMERFCLMAADLLISPSRFMLNELKKRDESTTDNIVVIPNPFKKEISGKGNINKVQPDQIVFYGKLTIQKGAFKLLEYFQELWNGGFNEPLYLIGGQDIIYHPEGKAMGDIVRERYKKYIACGLLKLEDRIPPVQMEERLSKAKLVIIPSTNDNLPYVVFEMMSLGKIVLVSKQGGQAEVVDDGKDGFVFDHETRGSFQQKLKEILSLSDSQRQLVSANAKGKVEQTYNPLLVYKNKISEISGAIERKISKENFTYIRPLNERPKVIGCKEVDNNLLSIVIPYYNMGRFIEETIRSLEVIDYDNVEILIIDDGSTDSESLQKLEVLRTKKNIKVYQNKNAGLAYSRNFGASKANGRFLAFLDADDLVGTDYYSKAIKVLSHYDNIAFVGCWTQYFGKSNDIWPTFNPEPPLILYHNLVNSSSLVYKRKAFLEVMNDTVMPFQGWEDYENVISFLEKGYNGVVLPETLFFYRIRKNSMIRSVSKTKKILLSEYISFKHKTLYNRFATELFNFQNANGQGYKLDNPSADLHLADYVPFGGKLTGKIISAVKKNKRIKKVAYKIYKSIKNR